MMHLFTKLAKPILGLALLSFAVLSANAQVATNYNFSQSNGTYAAISGGTVLGTNGDDDERYVDPATPAGGFTNTGPGFPIGFSYSYNGFTYDRFAVNANGWVSFGTAAGGVDMASTSSYSPLASTTAITVADLRNRIAGLAQDLEGDGANSELMFSTIGTAPNRILVVQWTRFKGYGTAQVGSQYNFQIRLYETSNIAEVMYDDNVSVTTRTPQVGLGGISSTDYNSRTGLWATSAAAATNAATMTMSATVNPTAGLTYTWTPSACSGTLASAATAITGTTATANWNAAASAVSYNVQYRVVGSATWTAFAGNPVTGTSANLTGLTALTSYEYQVQVNCAAGLQAAFSASSIFNTDCAGNSCPITFNLTDTYGDGWNGNTILVRQNGVLRGTLVLTDPNFTGTVFSGTQIINVCDGLPLEFVWGNVSSFPYEMGFTAVDGSLNTLYTLTATAPAITQPLAVAGNILYAGTASCSGCPTTVLATSVTNQPTCTGAMNGTASVTATAGAPAATYAWSNGGTAAMLMNADPGTYTVTVTNNCGGTSVASVTLAAVFTSSVTGTTAVSCNGGTNGAANITLVGAGANPTFAWSNGATSEDITGVAAGVYTVTINAAGGCTATLAATVAQPTTINNALTPTPPSCFGGNNGAIDLTVSGGTQMMPVAGTLTTSFANNNGSSGNMFDVDVTTTTNITGFEVNLSSAAASAQVVDVYYKTGTWVGSETDATAWTLLGNINVTSAGTGLATPVSLPTPLPVSAGSTYAFFVASAGGMNYIGPVNTTGVGNAWYNDAVLAIKQGVGRGGNTFTAGVFPSSGSWATESRGFSGSILYNLPAAAPYTYAWSTTATSQDITGLSDGIYTVTVTDGNACTATSEMILSAPSLLEAISSPVGIACYGGVSGPVTLMPAGGTMPYAYNWSNGNMTDTQSGLIPGIYNVTITDANACTTTASLQVTQPTAALTATTMGTPALCFGQANGSAMAMAMDGTAPYTYTWSNTSSTSDQPMSLPAGPYNVTITDANGCTTTATGSITAPAAVTVSLTNIVNNASCSGTAAGSATAIGGGGNGSPYTYMWDNGDMTDMAMALGNGVHTVTVSDANTCSVTATVTITSPGSVAVSASSTSVSCFGAMNGTATANVTGGAPAYTYVWSNSGNTATISNLMPGTYTATVTDAGGCSSTTVVTIAQPAAALSNTFMATNVVCFGSNTGTAMAMTMGGTTPYTYSWSNDANLTTANNPNLFAGDYFVLITDANGCTTNGSVTITQAAAGISAVPTTTNETGPSNGAVSLNIQGGTAGYTVAWSNGANTQNITGLSAGTYCATITDATGCTQAVCAVVALVIETENTANFSNVNAYPNPTVGPITLHVQLAAPQDVTVDIFAVTGVSIFSQTMNDVTDQNFNFDLSEMPAGMYFARIKAGDETKIVKISAITK
jgi:Secretion system C-terminal sorting domain/SprB repeat/Fibronectin type III domain